MSQSLGSGVGEIEGRFASLPKMVDDQERRFEDAVTCESMLRFAPMETGQQRQPRGPALTLVSASPQPVVYYQVRSDQEKEVYQILLRAVRKSCPRWLSDHVEDLAHKSMLRLLEKDAKAAEAGSYCSSYLYQVAASVVLNEIRAHRRRTQRVQIATEPDVEAWGGETDTENNPEQGVAASQTKSKIYTCLEGISKDRRAALVLGIQGYTTKQIAQRLGWDTKRTQNLLTRGRQDLRACLSQKGGQ